MQTVTIPVEEFTVLAKNAERRLSVPIGVKLHENGVSLTAFFSTGVAYKTHEVCLTIQMIGSKLIISRAEMDTNEPMTYKTLPDEVVKDFEK